MHETVELRARLHELVDQAAASGTRELPSLRDLAAQFEVAPNTVKKVLLELDGDVRVFAVHGRGFFLHLPGDPEPGVPEPEPSPSGEADEELPPEPWHIPVDERYSPVPEEGRATRKERRGGRARLPRGADRGR